MQKSTNKAMLTLAARLLFLHLIHRRLPHLLSNVSLTAKELESASLLLEMCEVSLETLETEDILRVSAQGPRPALANGGELMAHCAFHRPQQAQPNSHTHMCSSECSLEYTI